MNIDDVKEDLKKKNYKKALISIEKILIKNPNLEQNVNLKGVILANLDRVIEARECWFNAIKINSSYFDPIYNLGDSYLKKKNKDIPKKETKIFPVTDNFNHWPKIPRAPLR